MASSSSADDGGSALTQTPASAIPTPRSGVERLGGDADAVVHRFVAGELAALADVYQQTSPLVYTAALRALTNQRDAETVTRQVYLHAWRGRGAYDPSRRTLRDWLVAITRDVVAATIAERSHEPRPEQPPDQAELVEKAPAEIMARRIVDAVVVSDGLTRLEPAHRKVVELSFFDGLTHTQVADALGISVGSVKSHLKHGLAQLKRRWEVSDGAS
jgi:RNA polymerase sigma-70 factor (ECF subfamily)